MVKRERLILNSDQRMLSAQWLKQGSVCWRVFLDMTMGSSQVWRLKGKVAMNPEQTHLFFKSNDRCSFLITLCLKHSTHTFGSYFAYFLHSLTSKRRWTGPKCPCVITYNMCFTSFKWSPQVCNCLEQLQWHCLRPSYWLVPLQAINKETFWSWETTKTKGKTQQ